VDAVTALFPLPDDVTAEDAEAHAAAVEALLAGGTAEGREERAALEEDLGPLGAVVRAGTLVEEGELRSYVHITAGDEVVTAWYALEDLRGVAAVEILTAPPTTELVPAGAGAFAPRDPADAAPEVTLTFTDDELTIAGPGDPVTARRQA
ncbi:MAG TPA: hypothetical protein VGO60_11010, partial [Iamia sp.]|nr:hypothetical protein [Iamia sp.]